MDEETANNYLRVVAHVSAIINFCVTLKNCENCPFKEEFLDDEDKCHLVEGLIETMERY